MLPKNASWISIPVLNATPGVKMLFLAKRKEGVPHHLVSVYALQRFEGLERVALSLWLAPAELETCAARCLSMGTPKTLDRLCDPSRTLDRFCFLHGAEEFPLAIGAADTEAGDTGVADTDVADDEVADTDAAEADVADTDFADTRVADPEDADTGVAIPEKVVGREMVGTFGSMDGEEVATAA